MQDLLKSFVNEVSRVPIGHEVFSKVCYFLMNMLGVRYSNCYGDQSFKDNRFLRRVVKGVGVEVRISVGLFFSIHLKIKRATLVSGEHNIKKGNVVILLYFHVKFNVR